MPSCGQCRLSRRKQLCSPQSRAWPDPCDYCLKSGYSCSRFMTSHEFDSLSEAERAALQVKIQLRSSQEIIADLDCLFYLKESINRINCKISERLSRAQLPKKDRLLFHSIKLSAASAYRKLSEEIKRVSEEAKRLVRQFQCKGDWGKAYLIGRLASGCISYSFAAIEEENCSEISAGNLGPVSLDKSTGLVFRWFKGLWVAYSAKYLRKRYEEIEVKDIRYLYETLHRIITRFHGDAPMHDHISLETTEWNILERSCELFASASWMNEQSVPDPSMWLKIGHEFGFRDISAWSGESVLHPAIKLKRMGTVKRVLTAIEKCQDPELIRAALAANSSLNQNALHLAVIQRDQTIMSLLIDAYRRNGIADEFGYIDGEVAKLDMEELVKIPLTSFMMAILCQNELGIRMFMDFGGEWLRGSPAALLSVLKKGFWKTAAATPLGLWRIGLKPIHLAGLTEQLGLFQRLFIAQKDLKPEDSILAVLVVGLETGNPVFVDCLKLIDQFDDAKRRFLPIIKEFGTSGIFEEYYYAALGEPWEESQLPSQMHSEPNIRENILTAAPMAPEDYFLQSPRSFTSMSIDDEYDASERALEGSWPSPANATPQKTWRSSSHGRPRSRVSGSQVSVSHVSSRSKVSSGSSANSMYSVGGLPFVRSRARARDIGNSFSLPTHDIMETDQEAYYVNYV